MDETKDDGTALSSSPSVPLEYCSGVPWSDPLVSFPSRDVAECVGAVMARGRGGSGAGCNCNATSASWFLATLVLEFVNADE